MTTLQERIVAGRAEASHDDKPKIIFPLYYPPETARRQID
jgi:hypothetical protein